MKKLLFILTLSLVNVSSFGQPGRWYNHAIAAAAYNVSGNTPNADNLDSVAYYGPLARLIEIWPDSNMHYPAPNDSLGINYLAIAQTFQPQGPEYNSPDLYPNEVAGGGIITLQPYLFDSLSLLGKYTRIDTSLVDTLIFAFTYESYSGAGFHYPFYATPAGIATNTGVDSFINLFWSGADYLINPPNQVYSTAPGSYYRIKVPLDNAAAADTITTGILRGLNRIGAAPNISMQSGLMSAVSVAYKPSSLGNYPNGSTIDHFNHFSILAHKPDTLGNGYAQYMPGDFNMSYFVTKDTVNTQVNDSLNRFIPTLAFDPTFFPQELDISFKVQWFLAIQNTPKSIASIKAYPNPATTILTIPLTMSQAGNVSITLTNVTGQVVMTQDLGTVTAGATKIATLGISPLASGTYFYTVTAGLQTVTNRITITH